MYTLDKNHKSNKCVIFQADDCNDEHWEEIIKILKKELPGFKVGYGKEDFMSFEWNITK